MSPRSRSTLLAIAVGLVLADSSIVTLALPDILDEFGSTPQQVAWVLISFNLVLAVGAIPAARWAMRANAGAVVGGGLVVFAAASLACALAPSLGFLIAARCLQGIGGAAVISAALDVLATTTSRARGAALWTGAGAIGAAVGPAVGGVLTDAISWQSIFVFQVPVSLACVAAVARLGTGSLEADDAPGTEPTARPATVPLAALGLLSGGLAGALFLLVLLLVEGWRLSPAVAALVVSVMPVSALVAGLTGERLAVPVRGTLGAVLVGGGLAALGLLPEAHVAWTIAPQVAVGVGLGLGLSALTDAALADRRPLGLHGGWTIAARHAGIVLALAVLTPVFTGDLERQGERAEIAGTALLLDAPLSPDVKISLAMGLAEQVRESGREELPDTDPVFDRADPPAAERPALDELESRLEEELDKAATAAFSLSFLVAAGLALLALVPLALSGDVRGPPLGAGAAVAVPLVAVHLALGGAGYEPTRPGDPCRARAERQQGERFRTLERLFLHALDGAACELDVSRERLLLSLTGARPLPADIPQERRNEAFRQALRRTIERAREEGHLSEVEAFALTQAVELLPIEALVDRLRGEPPQGG